MLRCDITPNTQHAGESLSPPTDGTPRLSAGSFTSCDSEATQLLPRDLTAAAPCCTPDSKLEDGLTEPPPWIYRHLDPYNLLLDSKLSDGWPRIECHASHGTPESIRSPLLHPTCDSQVEPMLQYGSTRQNPSRGRQAYNVILFAVAAGLPFTSVNLLAPNLSAAARDFHFDDLQRDQELGGYLMAGFFLVGAPAALISGYLVDKVNRRDMLFWMLLLSSLPSIATFWVHHYWQLLALRLMVGVAVGTIFPLVFSLMGDLCATQQRSSMSAVVQIAVAVGVAAGQLVSGILGPATSWRLPFLVTAVPAIPVAVLLRCTTVDPQRGCAEAVLAQQYAGSDEWTYEETVSWEKVKQLLRIPSNWLAILQGLPGSLPWGMFLTFFIDYLHKEKGLAVQMATTLVLLFGVGGGIGMVAGGMLGQALYNRHKWMMGLVMGLPVLIGILPMFALVNCNLQEWGLGTSAFVTILLGIVASMPGPGLRALILNVNEPETRGIAIALHSTMDEVGKGLGPALAAWLITVAGRRRAFNMSMFLGWIPCGILLLGTMFTIRRDEHAMQQRLKRCLSVAAVKGSVMGQEVDVDITEALLDPEMGYDDTSVLTEEHGVDVTARRVDCDVVYDNAGVMAVEHDDDAGVVGAEHDLDWR